MARGLRLWGFRLRCDHESVRASSAGMISFLSCTQAAEGKSIPKTRSSREPENPGEENTGRMEVRRILFTAHRPRTRYRAPAHRPRTRYRAPAPCPRPHPVRTPEPSAHPISRPVHRLVFQSSSVKTRPDIAHLALEY